MSAEIYARKLAAKPRELDGKKEIVYMSDPRNPKWSIPQHVLEFPDSAGKSILYNNPKKYDWSFSSPIRKTTSMSLRERREEITKCYQLMPLPDDLRTLLITFCEITSAQVKTLSEFEPKLQKARESSSKFAMSFTYFQEPFEVDLAHATDIFVAVMESCTNDNPATLETVGPQWDKAVELYSKTVEHVY